MDEGNKSETQEEIQEQKNEFDGVIIDSSEENEKQNGKTDENHEIVTMDNTCELLIKH